MVEVCYRDLHRYKYQLKQAYVHDVGKITKKPVDTDFLKLDTDGRLTIREKYAWDGPSGPAPDTKSFMRGSLVHDALYQLIRMEEIPDLYQAHADRLLYRTVRADGMWWFWALWVYWAVYVFGWMSAVPGSQEKIKVICAPSGRECDEDEWENEGGAARRK